MPAPLLSPRRPKTIKADRSGPNFDAQPVISLVAPTTFDPQRHQSRSKQSLSTSRTLQKRMPIHCHSCAREIKRSQRIHQPRGEGPTHLNQPFPQGTPLLLS
ncbi:hypothetical protein V6N13_138273 [Hibiscus sabdariffa]|uniref:Uncharacterized protein n=1 Tax=Hibiscus sabdariffa TaxID=183260 RepID=A0ABR2QD03_9ROSI